MPPIKRSIEVSKVDDTPTTNGVMTDYFQE